ncbi:hypothetical protein C0J52_08308 [Blattella germanica]|nr:hypothetical protein C0J52_08308 [Blattella germanica]
MKQVYDWCLSKKIITRVICHKPNEFLNKKWDVLRQLKCDVTTRRTSTPNWIRSTSKPTTELPKMITSSKPTQITTLATNTLNDVTRTVFTEEPKPYSSTQGWDREKPDIDTNSANDTFSIETTKMLEVSTILSFSAEDYYNASFSQHQDADARVSSIILYLLVTLCVLFCIMAGLLAKFVFKNRRLKTPSSNDFSTVDDHNGESEIHSVKLANEATGIENHNFDATKPATTGPICLPMKLIDKSPLKGNNCIKHNSSDLHPYQTEQVAIVHQSDDGVN